MSAAAGVDYSAWDHIYVSDDEDVTSPFVDTPSLYRMRHRTRLARTAEFQQRRDDLESSLSECGRLLEEAQGRLRQLEEDGRAGEAELWRVQAEVSKLRKDKKSLEKMQEEQRREEKKLPWNVDTISKEGFSRSVLNVKPPSKEDTEEEKHKNFAEKHMKEIKHFGMMHRWDDSQKYLSENTHLVCEETANSLIVLCIDFEIEEKHALMQQVAHQAIVMQFILDLSRTLDIDPRGCFRQFFSKMKTADKPYLDAFQQELELLKERVRSCARERLKEEEEEEEEEEEDEEEDRQGRLGPGGLDPSEVYSSLPKEMQRSFDEKNVQMLHDVLRQLDPEEGKYHMRRCIDSGLWVPDSGEDHDEDEEED